MADFKDNRRLFLDGDKLIRNDRPKVEQMVPRRLTPIEALTRRFEQCRSLIQECNSIQTQLYERLKGLESRIAALEKGKENA